MKKTLLSFVFVCVAVGFAGCMDDKGNYDYKSTESVTPKIVSGIDDVYRRITLTSLAIDPTVDGNEGDYDYTWYAFKNESDPIDTLGREKSLDYVVGLPAGIYTLIFKVESKANRTCAYKSTRLEVSSQFGQGFFVLKDRGGVTDMDFIRDGEVSADVLSVVNGEGLPGDAVKATFTAGGYSYEVTNPDNTTEVVKSESAFFITSEDDMRVYDGESMKMLARFEDAFMDVPAEKKPGGVYACLYGQFALNGGRLFCLTSALTNVGKFGYPWVGDYDLSPNIMQGMSSSLAYDRASKSFHLLNPLSTSLAPMLSNFNGYDLLYMGHSEYMEGTPFYGYGIVKSPEGKHYLFGVLCPYNFQLLQNQEVPAEFKVLDAKVFGMAGYGKDVIFFSPGDNTVGYYNFSNQTEREQILKLPEGEKVVYLKHIFEYGSTPEYLAVLANKDGRWSLYCYSFDGSTPDVKAAPTLEYHGQGDARSVIYRDTYTAVVN